MESRADKAYRLFREGCNCSQAVVCAFAPDMGLSFESAMRLSSSFGGGMGRLREVCGAVSGMFMVLGWFCGYDTPGDFEGKKELYAKVQQLAAEFRGSTGSIICREMLGAMAGSGSVPERRDDEYYKKRPCPELVRLAAKTVEDYLVEQGKID